MCLLSVFYCSFCDVVTRVPLYSSYAKETHSAQDLLLDFVCSEPSCSWLYFALRRPGYESAVPDYCCKPLCRPTTCRLVYIQNSCVTGPDCQSHSTAYVDPVVRGNCEF